MIQNDNNQLTSISSLKESGASGMDYSKLSFPDIPNLPGFPNKYPVLKPRLQKVRRCNYRSSFWWVVLLVSCVCVLCFVSSTSFVDIFFLHL